MAGIQISVTNMLEAKNKLAKVADEICHEKYMANGPAIGEEFIEICTPFIPKASGQLINNGRVMSTKKDEVKVGWYRTRGDYDIARMMYYDSPHHWEHEEPRTDHWDKVAMATEGELFRKRVGEILNK